MLYYKIKRIVDIVLSAVGLIILSPILFMIAIIIKIDSKGPVLFIQNRVGKDKKIFKMIKFRTMRDKAPKEVPTHMLTNPEMHITKVGKFLRKTSLDELPQIWNILIGDMSIIGPRPALWNQYDLIMERDKYRANNIRPGLTGLAQINGRDELSIEAKAKLDGEYTKNVSPSLDAHCFYKTIIKVIKSEGVAEGEKDLAEK